MQNIEDSIVPVPEVFRLQNADELMMAEERYLPNDRIRPARSCWRQAAGAKWGM